MPSRRRYRKQKGGLAPLLALMLPSLAAAGKSALMAGATTGASYGVKKSMDALKKYYKRKKRKRKKQQ